MAALKVCVSGVAALLFLAVNLSAQGSGRDVLARFDRRLDTTSSRRTLESLADSLEALPAGRIALPLAMVRFRQGELGEPERFLRSESLLESAVEIDPSSADAWLFLGLTRARLGEAGYTGKLGPLQGHGEGYFGGAANALQRALELRPGNMEALQALLALVEDKHYPGDPEELLPYFDAAVAHQPGVPEAHLAVVKLNVSIGHYAEAEESYDKYLATGGDTTPILVPDDRTAEQLLDEADRRLNDLTQLYLFQAQVRITEGDYDSALTAIDRYAEAGGDRSRYLFEKARALFGQGNNQDATLLYYRGAAKSPPAVDMYKQDIAWIADSSEILEFGLLSGEGRAAWLRDFWEARDAADAQPFGTRLAEHHRRLAYANGHYRRPRFRRLGSFYSLFSALPQLTQPDDLESVRSGDDPEPDPLSSPFAAIQRPGGSRWSRYDDRGMVYIRYGEPDDVANPVIERVQSDSWLYSTPNGPMIVHFNGPFMIDFPRGDLMAHCELDAIYCVIAGKMATGSLQDFNVWRVKEKRRKEADRLLHSDANPARFTSALAPVIQLYGMPDGILAVYALSSEDLHKIDSSTTGSMAYPLRLRLSAAAINGSTRAQVDTSGVLTLPAPPEEGEYLASIIEMKVPPGAYLTSLAVTDTSGITGAAVRLPRLEVPAFGEGRLAMSDLILGKSGGLVWRSGEQDIALNPLGAYQEGGSAELYYQVDGQTAEKTYLTHIAVMEEGDDPIVSLEFREAAASPRQWYHRALGLARVRPGTYRVRVSITDMESGAQISREQRLNVTH